MPRHRPRRHRLSIDSNSSSLASNHDQYSRVERWLDHHPSHADRYSDAHQPIRRGVDDRPLHRHHRRAHSHSPRRSRREDTHHRFHRSRHRSNDPSPLRARRSSTYRGTGDALMRREDAGPLIARAGRHYPERWNASPAIDESRAGSWTYRSYRITSESPSPPARGCTPPRRSIRSTIRPRSSSPLEIWYDSRHNVDRQQPDETIVYGPRFTEEASSRMPSEIEPPPPYYRACSPHRDQNRGIGGYRYSLEDHPSREMQPGIFTPRCRRDSW